IGICLIAASRNGTTSQSRGLSSGGRNEVGYPSSLQDVARRVKATLQMVIGLYAVGWLAWSFYLSPRAGNCVAAAGTAGVSFCYSIPPSAVVFKVVADALAAATVVQLAFALFTPGPDEALDPVLLALAATLLIGLGNVTTFSWKDGGAAVLY